MTVRIPPATPNASTEVFTIDFRETAPGLSNKTMYVDDPLASRWGGLAVGVPGELRGLEEAHRRWGSLPWKTLVKPAADLAKGWAVPTELARRIEVSMSRSRASYARVFISYGPCYVGIDVLVSDAERARLASYLRS